PAQMIECKAVLFSHFKSPFIGRFADMVGGSSRRVARKPVLKAALLRQMVENGFGQGRTANISKTNKQDLNHNQFLGRQFTNSPHGRQTACAGRRRVFVGIASKEE